MFIVIFPLFQTSLRNHTRTHPLFFDDNADRSQTFTSGSTHSDDVNDVRVNNEHRYITSAVSQHDTAIPMDAHTDNIGNIIEQSDNNGNTGSKLSRRRRSGIPRPIRRSQMMENGCSFANVSLERPTVDGYSGITKQSNSSANTRNKAGTEALRTSTGIRELIETPSRSRRLMHVVAKSTKPTQIVDKNKQRGSVPKSINPASHHRQPNQKTKKNMSKARKEMRHMSPFGKHVPTAVSSPVTSANKQTPTLRGGNTTSVCGRGTPLATGKGTPVNSKRTPLSARRDTHRSNAHSCKKCGKAFLDKAKLDVHNTVHARETSKCRGPKYATKNLLTQVMYECSV